MDSIQKYIERLEGYSPDKLLSNNYKLDVIQAFLDFLGSPQRNLEFIHITGTSGKGSTATYTSQILKSQGVKVGTFLSPHVVTPLERIQINGENISEADFKKYFEILDKQVKDFVKITKNRKPTYFEFLFGLSLVYFKDKQVDVGVVEVGLGGKLDATNVINAKIAVITNIGLDHTKILGNTVEAILKDKQEIIKEGALVVSGVEQSNLRSSLSKHALNRNAKILQCSEEFTATREEKHLSSSKFKYRLNKTVEIADLHISMPGAHQIKNASIALTAAIKFLENHKISVDLQKLRRGLSEARLPGRIEIKQQKPLIIWDAAHNSDKMKALIDTLTLIPNSKLVLLIAVKRGQEVMDVLSSWALLKDRLSKVVLTRYNVIQDIQVESEDLSKYKHVLSDIFGTNIEINPDAKQAYAHLRKELRVNEALIVTGSFYLLSYLEN